MTYLLHKGMPDFVLKNLKVPHRLILAPMCGITLKPFRKICKENGAGLVFNQMVSAKALTMMDKKSLSMMSFDEIERPVGLQLFGNDANTLAEAARIMESHGPDVIDLNLGCPAKKIVNDGGGSALLTDETKLRDILRKMRKAIQGIFTIKIRAGWDDKSKNSLDVARMAEDEGIDAIALHARTRAQGYTGHADWDFIRHLKETVKIPIIGNGDVKTAADAHRMIRETGCDAVMTGRGAFETPWIFKNFVNGEEVTPNVDERREMILKQYEYAIEYHGAIGGIKMMRKHLCSYTKGLRGGSEFRNDIVRMTELEQILARVSDFFSLTRLESNQGSDHSENISEDCES
jgi:nifR3 family TIM-barrel protein